MKMAFSTFIVLLVLKLLYVESSNDNKRPTISSHSGHLFFQAPVGGNITLETLGGGKVNLNGVDLTKAVMMVLNASTILDKYKTNFESSFKKIDDYDKYMFGKNGFVKKLERLKKENDELTNLTASPVSDSKLNKLQHQLNSAMAAMRVFTNLLRHDECKSNPCSNGGSCQDLYNNFICRCTEGWEGQHCDVDVNECSRFVGTDLGCQNGATCINKPGTYQCLCPNGWYGIHCTRRSRDCNSGSSSSLCGHGTCIPQNNNLGYKCLCDQGYTNSNSSQECVDFDECKSGRPPCSVNPLVACINTPGSFRCGSCPEGFTGNGFYCRDIDECQSDSNVCSKNTLVECINTLGSYICGPCPLGYSGDGRTCTYQGICNVNNGGCHPLASCQENKNNPLSLVQCTCPPGYFGNGMGPNGCVASNMTALSPCDPNPCKNGQCVVTNSSYRCICNAPYLGKNCENSLFPCASSPCKNGGSCITRGYTFKCSCPLPWTGPTCANERSACGGVLTQESGILKYPPSNFSLRPEIRSCAWIIETSKNQILNLKFTEFHMKYTKDCNKDWVQLHDGRNTATHTLGRYCGSEMPKNGSFSTTHNAVYIWFRTDGTSSNSGFELSWDSATPVCNFNLTTTSHGSIQSPGSPGNYPNNRDCYWMITVPAGKRLLFHFFSFDVGNSLNCSGDYLEILPSSNLESVPFAKYCNSSVLPSPLNTPGSVATVHFHSDDREQHPGFQISYSVVEGIPGCGGTFTNNRGELQSPSFGGRYLNDLNCEYKIKLAPNLRVKLEFITFGLEADATCKFDFLKIFEGPDTNSPLIGRYCGNTLPGPYLSNGNEVTIQFKTDWATGFEGFHIRYETVCGGKFTEKTGIITSDGYPVHYAPRISCLYEIIQPPGYVITLSFLDFQIEHSVEDCFDYVEIRDGDNENSTLIGTYCSNPPAEIVSSLNHLWIKFVTDESVGDKGFRANYSATNLGCGGILKDTTGIISPQLDSGITGSSLNCNWVIKAPPGNLIRVIWLTFQLRPRYICDHDYVLVYDNNTITGRGGLIGKYCGSKIPPSFISTSNMITLTLNLERSSMSSGFTLSYNFVKEAKLCGGDFHSPGGVIRYPNDQERNSVNVDCTWTITVQPGHQIMLNVTKFSVQVSDSCRYHYLEIRNGKSASSPLIGKYCGYKMPKLISSHANQIYLHFKIDTHSSGGRFEVIWGSAATGCGGILSAPSGSIVSPMYPEPYHKFTNCEWKISVSSGSLVQIVFTDIDLEAHTFCSLDYVEVFDGSSAASKSLGKFCTLTHPTFIRTTQNHAYVRFKSDVSFQGRGFQLQYSTVCQNNITGFYGVIESPNFPNQYQLPEDCLWNIIVESRNKINITFTTFDIKSWVDYGNKTCSMNSLEIKYPSLESTSDTPTYDLYGKYCGQMETPKLISLDHNEVQIHYSTRTRMVGQGFRLEWTLDGCGGKLYKSGTIQSPNYPKGYPESSACRWELETDFGYSFVLSFTEIDLERVNDCHYDSIQVYNGPDNTYPKLAHFCHQDVPIKVTSNGHKMSLYFTTDSSYQGRGFSANFTSVKSKCGGKLTMSKGSIFSPNYPQKYDRNDTCEWLVEVDENHLIDLVFDDVDLLTNDVFCNKNYIKVYDGPSAAYPVLTKVCGTKKPNTTITSTHNTMLVEFSAGTFVTTKGFMAHFSKACGARIVASVSGEIKMHPEFVDNNLNSNCSWTIVAPELNQHIALTITHMGLTVPDCSTNALRVYEGENANGKLLGEYCGDTLPGMLISRGNALHIVAEIYIFLSANYEVYDSTCGGTLNTLGGSIISPGFIDGITEIGTAFSESECEWTINVAPGNQIGLTFNDFKIPQSDKCKTDFLEIRQQNSSGKLLGTFCGDKSPADITNVGSLWMYLKISTNLGEKTTSGLKATFAIAHSAVLTATSGQIASPLYPKYFNTYNGYTWRISVTFGRKILIKFKEISLGVHYEPDCSNSGMKIYDGIDGSAPLLKALCEYDTPEPVKTSSNEAYITVSFTAGNSRFLVEWEETDSYIRPEAENSTVEGCGSNGIIDLTNHKNYTVKSPGFPNGYANNLNCEWILSTSSTNHLAIHINWLDLKSTFGMYSSCNYQDSVEIFSGTEKTDEWKSVKKLCAINETNSVYSTSNLMKVKFFSDYSGNATGFKAEINEECGGKILESEGNIIFDEQHVRGSKCQWNITVPTGKTISVDFPRFNIAPGQSEGCKNYLMLRNGLSTDSPPLGAGQYCGTRPPVLKTTSNVLSVKYTGSANIRGFILHFKAVSYACGGSTDLSMYENSTTIHSPNYPDVPLPHIDCVWIIRSPPGTSIQLDFHGRFDLTQSEGCTSEAVEVRNGGTDFSPLIGRFCKSIPSSQFSTDNIMYIKFLTDVDDPRNGFKATASLATCGGTHRGTSGRLAWSSDDSRLLHSKNNCTWHIVAPPDFNLVLTVDVLDTPLSNFGCVGSLKGVSIYSVDPISGKEVHVKDVCSKNDTHSPINISSNEAVLRFKHSGNTYSIKKFAFIYDVEKERCVYNLNTPSGRITSPGYPKLAYRLMHCKWRITVPEGKRIKLTFVDLDMDENLDYQNQGIVVLDSSSHRMPISIIRLYNGSNTGVATQVKSSSNAMVIFYWSVDAHGRGFSAVYDSKEDTVCQGSFNETSGSIPYPNATSFFCSWKRKQTHWNSTLKATATMHLNSRPTPTGFCRSGSSAIMVYSGSWYSQFSLCSNTTSPAILRTSYPDLGLQIWGKRKLMNYTFSYDTYACGGLRTDESGVITSPNYPNRPSSSFECSWLLKLPKEHQINISFSAFDLGDDCDKSFLEIFNGPTPTSPRIEKFCKDNKPISQSLGRSSILSERNTLLINYHFAADSKGKGFNITYNPIINGCGGIFHDKRRIIQTPQYPRDYPNNTECVWEVRAPDGYHISLSFIGRFHLEESDNCADDSLMVWDWRNEAWNHLNTLCGRETPANIDSIGNKMKIRFRSNGKIQARGFQAKWEFNCGGTFVATNSLQYIVSPGYPEKYPNYIKCIYTIESPGSTKIVNLKFVDFDLEKGMPNCVSDNVTLQSIGTYHDPLARTIYCDTSKPPENNYKYGVKITFVSDGWIVGRGFKFSFSTTGCGGNITSPTQISLPKVAIYLGNVECVWKIIAPPKKIISLRFLQLITPYTASCAYDNIEVHSGLEKKSENKLATFCGNLTNSLPTLNSPNNTLTITSSTDPNYREVKIVADIFFSPGPAEGCGGTFNLTSEKIIRSPNVEESFDCYWKFMAPVDYTIEFEIVELTMGTCTTGKCSCDFLEIRDGGSSLSTLITKVCNSSVSVTKYQTSTRYGFVRLYMNGRNSNAFRMKAKPIISPCGKSMLNVTGEVKTITSPNYPNKYPDNIRCRWFLKSEATYNKIVVRFKEFDLADETIGSVSNDVCKYDYLEIENGDQHKAYGEGLGPSTVFSGRGKSSTTYEYLLMGIHTFCGRNDRVFDYYSPTGSLALIFQSKYGKNPGKGFLIEYQLAGCNRNYTEDSGRIAFTLREQQDCLIGIEVEGNKTISLYFSSFFTSYSAKCTDDYLQIFDGNLTAGKELGKWCGYNIMDPVFSNSSKLWLKIRSNKDSLDTHIDITYTTTNKDRGCGGNIYDIAGTFTSPLYPKDFRTNTQCIWYIRGPPGTKLKLSFNVFDIQGNCDTNYLKVKTYDNGLENEHEFCKGDDPAVLISDVKFTVVYQASLHNGGAGWTASFKTTENDNIRENHYVPLILD